MFPFRLRFHVLTCITLVTLSCSGDALNPATDRKIAMRTCCRTGRSLDDCSEESFNNTFHVPPIGVCRSTMKLCCLLNQKSPLCDKDFIVTSYDRFCTSPSPKYETCCTACQIGEELATESRTCSRTDLQLPKKMINLFVLDIASECCDRKKRRSVRSGSVENCRVGFFFNRTSKFCEDINECAIRNNGCDESQDCVNSIGSYACIPRDICRTGFSYEATTFTCQREESCATAVTETLEFPVSVSLPIDMDSLTLESKLQNITIVPQNFLNPSRCRSGFEFNPKTNSCEDIDECLTMENHCRNDNSRCVNTNGSFSCQCQPGYELTSDNSSTKCTDIDECRLKRNVCDHYCVNLVGSFKCVCRRGFHIDSKNRTRCVDINECSINKRICSHDCRNVQGSYRCGCPSGFKLGTNQRTCEDVNECVEKRGVCAKGVCNNLIGSYACYPPTCPSGFNIYHFTKRNDFNKCVRNPCLVDIATCTNQPKYLTFKNVTLATNMTFSRRGVVLHNIYTKSFKFPVEFEYHLLIKSREPGIKAAEKVDFQIVKQETRALITLIRALVGPQQLQLNVDIKDGPIRIVEKISIEVFVI